MWRDDDKYWSSVNYWHKRTRDETWVLILITSLNQWNGADLARLVRHRGDVIIVVNWESADDLARLNTFQVRYIELGLFICLFINYYNHKVSWRWSSIRSQWTKSAVRDIKANDLVWAKSLKRTTDHTRNSVLYQWYRQGRPALEKKMGWNSQLVLLFWCCR